MVPPPSCRYSTGQRVEVHVVDFTTPGHLKAWTPGTVTAVEHLPSGRWDVTVTRDDGQTWQQRVSARGGNPNIRPLGTCGPHITGVRPAGDEHVVVTVTGGSGAYRRRPCGGPQSTPERPGCPWRVDAVGHFPAAAFEHSASTARDMSTHMFSCHESGTQRPATCAGFLLRGADNNLAVRKRLATGAIDPSQVDDGGHELHAGYVTMARANGVEPDRLQGCRLSYEEQPTSSTHPTR